MNFFVRTFGCQMNVHDSARITGLLTGCGYDPVSSIAEADVVIINTCSVREKAWHKAVSEVGRACVAKKRNRHEKKIVIAAGCVAEQEKERWFDTLDGVDLVVGPDHYGELPALVEYVRGGGKAREATGFDKGESEDFLTIAPSDTHSRVTQFVTVMKGCSERCMYCIVPSVRGPERCRPADDIEKEVVVLAEAGTREVMLLGQKVNAYKKGGVTFADLISRLDRISALERLRFTSPHPRHMTDALIDLFGHTRSLCESLHMPVQSGSNRTLERMGRRYTAEFYREVVSKLRRRCPEICISTDLIVGYPGETEEDFLETLRLLEDLRFAGAFSFKYSPRPGTPAADLRGDVSEQEKKERLARVHEVITRIDAEIRKSFIGKTLEVLVEREGRFEGQLTGRARNSQIVNFAAPTGVTLKEAKGTLMEVEVIRSMPHSLEGAMSD